MKVIAIIQARTTSTRLPGKVFMKVEGQSLIARVCNAARGAQLVDKVIVAWAHKFPHLDENDVLGRFREIATLHKPDVIVRLTSDCPLLTSVWIDNAIAQFKMNNDSYFSNRKDGFDVQVFYSFMLWSTMTHREHVIADFETPFSGLSVNTLEDLQRVREICATK